MPPWGWPGEKTLNALGAACSPGNCSSLALEENAFGPNTLPLWQFVLYTTALLPLTPSSEPGGWQFLSGRIFGNASILTALNGLTM
jgi:hypothetical protein